MKNFKPMLAGKCEDINKLTLPVLASPKLDGVRAVVLDGRLMARSLKEIPNTHVQKMFQNLPEGLDGELIMGDPTAPDAYRKTVSCVMSDDALPTALGLHLFDNFACKENFPNRLQSVVDICRRRISEGLTLVEHRLLETVAELEMFESQCLAQGYEGVMVRSLDGPYKFGRSTAREGYLLKIKRFLDSEAVVLDTIELQHNENEATTNELGHTQRSTCKAGKVPGGVLGALTVKDRLSRVCFEIGTGFTAEERASLWKERSKLVGKTVKYKYFPTGSLDKPRFPVFLGWRDGRDL